MQFRARLLFDYAMSQATACRCVDQVGMLRIHAAGTARGWGPRAEVGRVDLPLARAYLSISPRDFREAVIKTKLANILPNQMRVTARLMSGSLVFVRRRA